MPALVRDLTGGWMLEGFFSGRIWRMWFKPWAWPYRYHAYGSLCMGVGPIGFMLFDRRPLGREVRDA